MSSPILLRHTLALLVGIGLGAVALGGSVSADLHVPAARILVAECQGFEALATAGGKPLSCAPQVPLGGATGVEVPASTVPAAPVPASHA